MGWFLAGVAPSPAGRDVVHHRLQALADGAESSQAQQVESSGAQRRHHSGAVTALAVVFLMELDVTNPVPALVAVRLVRSSYPSALSPVAAVHLGWCASW